MFFGPTINSLASEYFIHLLCLSGGGTPREKELENSAQNLSLHRYECVSHPKLEDSMKEKWCEDTIRQLVSKYIAENSIRAVFTFDQHGISGHINHQAIYRSLSAI
jgi:N-acetylglucosaminylphosphatidylinositol deacetylase